MINFISSLSQHYKITLYFLEDNNSNEYENLFNSNVEFRPYVLKRNIINSILKHSFFWLEYYELYHIIKKNSIRKYDLIICHDLPVLYPAIRLAKYYKTKIIYDSLEIYNETINQFFPLVNGIFKKFISFLLIHFMRWNGTLSEKFMTANVDLMITVNESLANYFQEKYKIDKVWSVMNCPPLHEQKPTRAVDFKKIYNIDNENKIFIYQGAFNEGRGLQLLIKAFKKAVALNSKINLIFIGSGVLENSLRKMVIEERLEEHVKFFGVVPYRELINYSVAGDFGVNLLEAFNLSKKLASPNKLFEYIQAEIPVLCSYSPENNRIFEEYKIGEQCQNTIDDICRAILKLSSATEEELFCYSKNLSKAKSIYNWNNQEKILNSLVQSLIG